jgi:hypothetical protein
VSDGNCGLSSPLRNTSPPSLAKVRPNPYAFGMRTLTGTEADFAFGLGIGNRDRDLLRVEALDPVLIHRRGDIEILEPGIDVGV